MTNMIDEAIATLADFPFVLYISYEQPIDDMLEVHLDCEAGVRIKHVFSLRALRLSKNMMLLDLLKERIVLAVSNALARQWLEKKPPADQGYLAFLEEQDHTWPKPMRWGSPNNRPHLTIDIPEHIRPAYTPDYSPTASWPMRQYLLAEYDPHTRIAWYRRS